MTRRDLLRAGLVAATATAGGFRVRDTFAAATGASRFQDLFPELDRFVEQYMRDMNSPGLTLVLADRDGIQRTVTYGFGNLDRQQALRGDELFEIGSITKSFLAIVLLQLHEEGKLDLDRPVVDYLPWLRIQSRFAPITTHHLLTHSSGLPGYSLEPFVSDPSQPHVAAYAPGQTFWYNNMAYAVLGHLAWTLDGRELPDLFRERIFAPLGMSRSSPLIDFDMRERMPTSYVPFQSDRPYPRRGPLSEAPSIVMTNGAGCIAAPAADMGAYVRMIANHGRGPQRPLISPESFALFSKRHILAKPFGPTVSYGYGIAVDDFDGHVLLRHTGGMVSYMSSMMVDVDAGIGGFASVNAQQEYRPNPVVRYALQLMRARTDGQPSPAFPAPDSAAAVSNAVDYSGVYSGAQGQLEFVHDGEELFLLRGDRRIALQKLSEPDQFHVAEPGFERLPLVFGRKQRPTPDESPETPLPVVEVSYGDAWYPAPAYEGHREFDVPAQWQHYVGHYRNENPWVGSVRVVILKGRLTLNGVIPLEADGDVFRLRDDPANTEWIRFAEVVNGKCMRLKFSGEDLWRVFTA